MLIALFVIFFILLFINMPVGIAIGLSSVTVLYFFSDVPLNTVITRMYSGVDSFTLLSIPFFILAGELMNESGITDKIVSFAKSLVGHIKGGLAHVTVATSMLFSGISGSATADASAVGSVMIPAMKKNGIDSEFAVAVTASSSAIGPIIPPSILMIIYGSVANVSIAKLFLGGILPGILIGLSLMMVVYYYANKRNYKAEKRANLKRIINSFLNSSLALFMPVIILGGIFSGIFTSTEASIVAVLYAIIIGLFVTKKIEFSDLGRIFVKSAVTSSTAMLIIATSSIFAWILAWESLGEIGLNYLSSLTSNPQTIVILILLFVLILGFFIDGIPVLIILAPVVIPIINSFGIDPIYFGVLLVISIVLGSVTPPVGVLIFICCSIANTSVSKTFWILWPFCFAMTFVLFLCVFFPSLVTIFYK